MGGNFLSQPKRDGPGESDTDKESDVSYGVIGLQGWRTSMEDAHLCIPGLRKHIEQSCEELKLPPDVIEKVPDCSLFAVFDGHGGSEVARMCSSKFVQFLVGEESFLNGDYETALKDVYLKLDQFVISEEGQKMLQSIIEQADKEQVEEDDEDEDEKGEEDGVQPSDDDDDDIDDDNEDDEEGDGDTEDAEGEDDELEEGVSSEGVGLLLNSLMNNDFMSFLAKRTKRMHEELAALGDNEDDDYDFNPDEIADSDEDEDDDDEEDDDGDENEDEDDSEDDEGEEAKEKEKIEKTHESDTADKPHQNGTDDNKEAEKSEEASSSDSAKPVDSESVADAKPTDTALKGAEGTTDENVENGVNDEKTESISDEKATVAQTSTDAQSKTADEEEEGKTEAETGKDKSSINKLEESKEVGTSSKRKKKAPKKLEPCPSNGDIRKKARMNEYGELVNEDDSEDQPLLGDEFMDDNPLMQKPGYDSGCTAVVALKVNSKVYVANAGDSRCVLCHKGGATTLPLSRDHTPSVPEEAERVYLAGGEIRAGRVDGGLNLTRAIGDHRYKQDKELSPEKQKISCMPDITVTDLLPPSDPSSCSISSTTSCALPPAPATDSNGDANQDTPVDSSSTTKKGNESSSSSSVEDFLIVACDGLWECLPNEVAVQYVKDHLKSQNLFLTAQQLAQKCVAENCNQASGMDNVTAIVATLKNHSLTEKMTYVPPPKSPKKITNSTTDNCDDKQINNASTTSTKVPSSDVSSNDEEQATTNGEQTQSSENGDDIQNENGNMNGYHDNCDDVTNGKSVNGNGADENGEIKNEQVSSGDKLNSNIAQVKQNEDLKRRNEGNDSISANGDVKEERDAKIAKTDLAD